MCRCVLSAQDIVTRSQSGRDQVGALRRAIAMVPTLSTLSLDQNHITHMRLSDKHQPLIIFKLGDDKDHTSCCCSSSLTSFPVVIFSCEDAAQQVLMSSVCLSVCVSVCKLKL